MVKDIIIRSRISSTFIGPLDHMTLAPSRMNSNANTSKKQTRKINKEGNKENKFTDLLQRTLV